MTRRGPKLKPELQHYSAADAPGVYLIEIGDMVKVGCSRTPAARLRTLHVQHAIAGDAMGRFCVFPARRPYDAERCCIAALSHRFQLAPGRREYFTGCDFAAAVQVVRAALPAA